MICVVFIIETMMVVFFCSSNSKMIVLSNKLSMQLVYHTQSYNQLKVNGHYVSQLYWCILLCMDIFTIQWILFGEINCKFRSL